jgi:hypothetical protein
MHILRVEHSVDDYDNWKKAFDSDPIGRKDAGVKSYRIMRAVDDPNQVMIDLEFDSAGEAERMHASLKELWGRVDVMRDPHARAAEVVESDKY